MDATTPHPPALPHVGSEVGTLREVIVHRPGAELERLTPATMDELLWDDLMWVGRAQEEHDAFVDVLSSAGVLIHDLTRLLTETLAVPDARFHVLDATFTGETLGPSLAPALWEHAHDLDDADLAGVLISGLTGREVAERLGGVDTLPLHVHGPEGLVLGPLPNHLFTRDASCWVYDGVAVNSMRYAARVRESVHYEAIYRWHPRFAPFRASGDDGGTAIWGDVTPPPPHERGTSFRRWAAGPVEGAANVEGGDVLVVGGGAVVVGMSERTTPQGVEHLAARLFAAGSADRVLALAMPVARELMHLDTALTMVDERTFLLYGGLGDLPGYVLTPDAEGVTVTRHAPERMRSVIADVVGRDGVRFLTPELDARAAAREQWDDGCNALALAPGVVVMYDRAPASNAHLRAHGIEVIEVPGGELGRGRGGPRCMSCPVVRDAA